jgi:membrane protease YdiL (CAAX protease family)
VSNDQFDPPALSNVASETSPVAIATAGRPRVGRVRWSIHLLLIGGYFLPVFFVNGPSRGPVLTHTVRGLITVCAFDLTMFAVIFGVAWLISRASREELFLVWRPGWLVLPLGLAYSLAIRLAIVILMLAAAVLLAAFFDQQQLRHFWQSSQPDVSSLVSLSSARRDRTYAWLLITLVSFVSAGLREELWRAGTLAGLRALWPTAFGSRTGQVVAIVLIAIAFGAAHFHMGVLAAILAGVLGLLFGLIMVIHRSVWPAVIAHGSFDALSFALLAWLPDTFQQLR